MREGVYVEPAVGWIQTESLFVDVAEEIVVDANRRWDT